ncbi:MAG: alpha-E domain-containing protein, partial [Deltaproteobacteria bacterium]|nr:alpha-E domain-containing protein [Deltaproteobacteria bacterium]
MLSRIADSLYWMSRYLERAGNTARLVEINLVHLLEAEDALPEAAQWKPLLSISSSEEAYQARYEG